MSGAGYIVMVLFIAMLAVSAYWQPSWLPKWARAIALIVITVIATVAAVTPTLSNDKTIPTWAVYLLTGVSLIFVLCLTAIRWLFYRFIDRSSHLREVIKASFQIMLEHESLELSEFKTRAESQVGTGIRFNRWVWTKALEILEQEKILKKEKIDA